MANIGDIFGTMRVDDSKLGPEAEKAGLRAADSFGTRFRSAVMGPSFSAGLGAGVGIAAFGLFTHAVSAVTDALGGAITAAIEDERSVRLLSTAIRASIPEWDGQTTAVEDAVAQGQALAFTDDDLRASMGKLVTATKDVSKSIDLQSLAMDFARLRGISLEEATTLVVKAQSGQIGALRKVLPWIDKNATATEALAAMQTAAQGSAEAYADTTEGRMLRAQIQMNEAMEKLGYLIMPVVSGLAGLAADMLPKLTKAVEDAAAGVGDLVNELVEGAGVVAGSDDAWGDLRRGIDFTGYALETIAGNFANNTDDMITWEGYVARLAVSTGNATDDMVAKVVALGPALHRGGAGVDTAARELGDYVPRALSKAGREAVRLAGLLPGDLAAALRTKRATWQDAIDLLGTDIENTMTRVDEIVKLRAALVGQAIVDGLRSKDPVVKAQAQATTQLIVDRLAELKSSTVGYGEATGNAYADGLLRSRDEVARAAKGVAAVARQYFEASSPPGPESPLHLIDVWGYRTGLAWAAGLASGVVAGKRGVVAGLGGAFTAAGPASYAGAFAVAPTAVSAMGAMQPAIIRLEIGGRPLIDYVDEHLAYLPRR